MDKPSLILPAGTQRRAPPVGHSEFGVFVPPEALFPDLETSEESLAALLGTLSRDAVLVACARLNMVVSGSGHPDPKPRQERAIDLICREEDLVVHHTDFDVLIPSHSRMGKFSGGNRISMLLGTPG